MTKIYTYSVKTKVKAFYIDAQAVSRLDEFFDLLKTFRILKSILRDVFHDQKTAQPESMRLKKLANFYNVIRDEDQDEEMKEDDEDSGIYPNYLPILDEFDRMIIWKSSGSSKIPEPRKGFDEEFDRVN